MDRREFAVNVGKLSLRDFVPLCDLKCAVNSSAIGMIEHIVKIFGRRMINMSLDDVAFPMLLRLAKLVREAKKIVIPIVEIDTLTSWCDAIHVAED